MKLTDDTPIRLRNSPDPKDKAKASKIPMPTAKSKAVDTEESCGRVVTQSKGLPLVLFSQSSSVQQFRKNGI